ncbi:MAG: CRISPR-associated helicase Cas3' [Bacteroidetes bacterium]|nr:MAG: CRISPR-associated helicase Cas3' [Bacteroidota bacterium]TAG86752.1 MAG: CRISPR-associated helicase Cas3' [Bacteroidota bacterium]
MSNYYKTVAELLKQTQSVDDFLIDAQKYYAHISNHKSPETLAQHLDLVQSKFEKLCEVHQLDDVIDKMIGEFVKENLSNDNEKDVIRNFIKKLFVNVVVFHDYGKVNPNFQADTSKMNNPNFVKRKSVLETHHSKLGAYLYIVKHFQEFQNNNQINKDKHLVLSHLVLSFSYAIFKHHAKYLNDNMNQTITFSNDEINEMKQFIQKYQFEIKPNFSETIPAKMSSIFHLIELGKAKVIKTEFDLYSLVRLSFSLLTTSDYLASGEYMTGIKVEDWGVLGRKRIDQIFENVQKNKIYNQIAYQKLNQYQFIKPTEVSNQNLNQLREEMTIEVIQNVRKYKDKNLFYIEAPTGGGKTNLSMIATIELLKNCENLNKVFYVFPFTTLVTQTYDAIIDTLGLLPDEIMQLHSKSGFKTKEEKEDGEYGNNKKNYIDNLFINYPFCFLTHIKFFDILKSNEKENNYLLNRLANSVVVIDELQSYNPSHWDKIIYFIRLYADFYHIKFILMSATLPKLDKLNVLKEQVDNFVYLLPNSKENYFQNKNFNQRVNFKFDLLNENKLELIDLANLLIKKSEEYSKKEFGDAKPIDSVYTIIEFIFKKSATEFYKIIDRIESEKRFFDEIFVLSGTILEHRRKYIINYLKNKKNRTKKILLITTQVVEAGVDIDMDLGFKNASLIDSDEQLAGRINRNVNKKDCELYIFKYNEPSILYKQDKRYEIIKKFEVKDYENILKNKNFDILYNEVLDNINKINNKEQVINLDDYKKLFRDLRFKEINEKFKLIEQDNISIFVPLSIQSHYFLENELDFLKNIGIFSENDLEVEGSKIFDLYVDLIENKRMDFIDKKVSLKILQGIMSKFIFSIFGDKSGKIMAKLIPFADIEKATIDKKNQKTIENDTTATTYGFVYLSRYEDIYDEVFGFDDTKLNEVDNCIL